ncbi:MAG: hypothetical protein WKF96_25360 [Solirubrobacteraceae bacterium]
MSPIPDDHPAARELERRFRELGSEKAAGAIPPPRRGLRTRVAVGAGMIITAATIMVVALTTQGSSPQPDRATDPVSQIVDDPGGADPWGVRGFIDNRGRRCVGVGRLRGGAFQRLANPSVRPLFRGASGTCLRDRDQDLRVVNRSVRSESGVRSLLYGVVSSGVRSLRVSEGGDARAVAVGRGGVFLLVRAGSDLFRAAIVIAESTRGEQRVAI